MKYAGLWCKSNFSFLEGASHPEELVERCAALGIEALALTDRDGVYGVVEAHVKALEVGVKLMLGTDVTVDDGSNLVLLAATREGWANVLLESMACGTPVVATPVDGTPEVVAATAAGQLTSDRSAAALVAALRQLFDDLPERTATRAYAEGFDWDETSRGQLEIFRAATAAAG